MDKQFLSCDWGTSSFRLLLVNAESGEIIHSLYTQEGVGVLFRHWQGLNTTEDKETFFLHYLGKQVTSFHALAGSGFSPEKIIISGMASASIGMRELPYATLPFSLDGTNAVIDHIFREELCPYPVVLVSGVKSDDDVMRGEETQMLGLRERVGMDSAVCVLPGTHAKHIFAEAGKITGFRTYMTGEIFQLLQKQSILAASVAEEASGWDKNAFCEGVHRAQKQPLLQSLFSVRTGSLFGERDLRQGYHYLSGLLIGSEVAGMEITPAQKIILSAPERLREAYKTALEVFGYENQTEVLSSEENNHLALHGHLQINRSVY
ncbi:MAG: 2-dehydro-3-deoxygalactonokinase [Bacteroidia bacterium]